MSTATPHKGQRKSPFIGRRVPLVQDGTPLLYPRYTHVSEVLAVSAGASGAPPKALAITPPETPSQPHSLSTTQPAALEDSTTKRKRDKPKKKKLADPVTEPAQQSTAQQSKKARKASPFDGSKQTSGASNADQAADLRARLGVASSASALDTPSPAPFSFGFGFEPCAALSPSPAAPFQASSPPAAEGSESKPPSASDVPVARQNGVEASPASEAENSSDSGEVPKAKAAAAYNAAPDQPAQVAKEDQHAATAPPQQPATPAPKNGGAAAPAPGQAYVPRRVFVGGMPFSYEESDIREYWSECGPIESLDILRFSDSGRFKGMVFITFVTEDAYNAALKCDGIDLDGQTLKVDRCKAKKGVINTPKAQQHLTEQPAKVAGYRVAYVGNISFEVSSEELRDVFADAGVEKVRLHTDKTTGQSKGYAHVHFSSEEGLEQAVKMSGHLLAGRNLKISYAQQKKTVRHVEQAYSLSSSVT